ncbi:MAG: rod shape-determining protein RodA [Clostridiales bacterium]|nr:rod shape-determining protein RodA [Clostridiales bacterium]
MLFDYQFKNYNFRLVLYALLLNFSGVLLIRSATNQDPVYVNKQILGILVGFVIAIILSLIDYHKIITAATGIYAGCLILLLAVLLIGKNVNNATRWLELPAIGQIQPSEFVKVGLIIFFAWFFNRSEEHINELKILIAAGCFFAIPFLLIFSEPDLSTGLVILFVFACMLYAARLSYRWIVAAAAVLIPCGALFVYLLQYDMVPFLKGYQATRILAFVNREQYAETNLQQNNSIMAIGSGMLHGKGLNNNTLASVKNGNFLSEEQTDFIFAVIGEELGFIGCVVVISLIALVVLECLLMAGRARDLSGRLLCVGMAALLAFQSFANIAVATGVFPNTGLPLPFISYGVSSLMSIYIGIGVILNVGLQRKLNT